MYLHVCMHLCRVCMCVFMHCVHVHAVVLHVCVCAHALCVCENHSSQAALSANGQGSLTRGLDPPLGWGCMGLISGACEVRGMESLLPRVFLDP